MTEATWSLQPGAPPARLSSPPPPTGGGGSGLDLLCDRYPRFLRFVVGRVGDPAAAEDILQSAYVKAVEKISDLRDPQKAVPWFLRIISSAIGQHFRREKAQRFDPGAETPPWMTAVAEPAAEAEGEAETPCLCAVTLLESIKPQYAAMVRAVDLEGRTPSAVADQLGISANNSRVRLYRARAALRRGLRRCCGGGCTRPGHRCRCPSRESPQIGCTAARSGGRAAGRGLTGPTAGESG